MAARHEENAKHRSHQAGAPKLRALTDEDRSILPTRACCATLHNGSKLIVKATNGQVRHGNMGTSQRFDRVNNVEQVVWENIPPGNVTITVHAFHITQFAQPYAYAWRIS